MLSIPLAQPIERQLMNNLLTRFTSEALAEGRQHLHNMQVEFPLRWIEENVIETRVKAGPVSGYVCRLTFSADRTTIQSESCSCANEGGLFALSNQRTCSHLVAVIIAFAENRSPVSPLQTAQGAPKTILVRPAQSTPQKPGGGRKNSPFNYTPPTNVRAKQAVRDDSKLILNDRIKLAFDSVANAFAEAAAIEHSKDTPDLAYLICDTTPGAFPEIKIINLKERKPNDTGAEAQVAPKSKLWERATAMQRHINAVRKMILPSIGKSDFDLPELTVFQNLWKFLLKLCLLTGRCYFHSLDTQPVKLGSIVYSANFSWTKENDEFKPGLWVAGGAPTLPWSMPIYLDKENGLCGEFFSTEIAVWYGAIWNQAAAPQEAYEAVGSIIQTLLSDPASIHQVLNDENNASALQHFPVLYRRVVDSARFLNRPAMDLCYSVGTGDVTEIPKLKVWQKQPITEGLASNNHVEITWDHVRQEGSWYQQFLAASVQKFLKHTSVGEIDRVEVATDLWFELIENLVSQNEVYWQSPFNAKQLRTGLARNGFVCWSPDHNSATLTLCAGTPETQCTPWFIPMYLDQKTNEIGLVAKFPIGAPLRSLRKVGSVPQEMFIAASNYIRSQNLEKYLGLLSNTVRWHDLKPSTSLDIVTDEPALDTTSAKGRSQDRTLVLAFEDVKDRCQDSGNVIDISTIDRGWIANCLTEMKSLGFVSKTSHEQALRYPLVPTSPASWRQLYDSLRQLKKLGIFISPKTEAQIRPLDVNESGFQFNVTDDSPGWFTMSLLLKIDDEEIELMPVLIAAVRSLPKDSIEIAVESLNERGKFFTVLPGGRLVSMPFERIKTIILTLHEFLKNHASKDGTKVKVSAVHALDLVANEKFAKANKSVCQKLTQIMQCANQLSQLEPIDPPPTFRGELRDYQKIGLSWLDHLATSKIGGILADDMGLGKTVQVIAKIALDKASSKEKQPVLVVCPTGLIENWRSELEKFTPGFRVIPYSGDSRHALVQFFEESDVVITSYTLLRRELQPFLKVFWRGVYLDEASTIKNATAATTKAVKELITDYKICITGTPIENNLGDLWSLFDFVMPGLFGSLAEFKEFIRTPIEEHHDPVITATFKRVVSPFKLRRLKSEVRKDLPPKTESIVPVKLKGRQAQLYETVRLLASKEVATELSKKDFGQAKIELLALLNKVRQVCLHPGLCKLDAASNIEENAKFEALFEKLTILLNNGSKILIFSQYVEMLRFIAEKLTEVSIPYVELTGQHTADARTRSVQKFQETDVQIFLISLRAGGVGLNLTKADTVFIYDPWWNPATEDQAIDRAHRIGQENEVFVFKLIASGTIEERMLALHEKKRAIANVIYDSEQDMLNALVTSEEDLRMLLSPLDSEDDDAGDDPGAHAPRGDLAVEDKPQPEPLPLACS